jgi:hypothetical protein
MDGHWGCQERDVSSNGANLDLIDNFASTTFNHKKCCIIVYLEDRYIWTEAVKNVEGWHTAHNYGIWYWNLSMSDSNFATSCPETKLLVNVFILFATVLYYWN